MESSCFCFFASALSIFQVGVRIAVKASVAAPFAVLHALVHLCRPCQIPNASVVSCVASFVAPKVCK